MSSDWAEEKPQDMEASEVEGIGNLDFKMKRTWVLARWVQVKALYKGLLQFTVVVASSSHTEGV